MVQNGVFFDIFCSFVAGGSRNPDRAPAKFFSWGSRSGRGHNIFHFNFFQKLLFHGVVSVVFSLVFVFVVVFLVVCGCFLSFCRDFVVRYRFLSQVLFN